ncbi:hypothetical protein GGR56DRAFT_540748 [Xylariaceae sp. FL0804]|nr:hypothetical protein GGR56DRAFT_540748 [Xylariaceae sp. FL0804]
MTEPAPDQPQQAGSPRPDQRRPPPPPNPPPFAPIFTLVNNASTHTTHHPHVRYIFSDDDPDLLTQALAEHDAAAIDQSDPDPATASRAMILDLQPEPQGGYAVAWSSSLSPSWAVLDASVSQISPPSSDASNASGNEAGESSSARPDRLLLRIEGVESGPAAGSEAAAMRISDDAGRQGSGGSASGSGQKDRDRSDVAPYSSIMDEFERRMATLRRVVHVSEDRRRKIGLEPPTEGTAPEEANVTEGQGAAAE